MKYFTPDRYLALQRTSRQDMDAADAAWEKAVERYEDHLKRLRPKLPNSIRRLVDEFHLHDGEVLSMGQENGTFVLVLSLAAPPRNLLVLTYELTEAPAIDKAALPSGSCSSRMQWLADEVDHLEGSPPAFVQAILFSNGWQVGLKFHTLQVLAVCSLLPATDRDGPAPKLRDANGNSAAPVSRIRLADENPL